MLEAYGLHTHIRSNRIKTVMVLAIFPFLLPLIVFAVGVTIGALSSVSSQRAFSEAAAYSVLVSAVVVPLTVLWVPIAYIVNQWIIDHATGARGVSRNEEMRVWNLLENLCISRGMATPALRIIEAPELNAYASGVSKKSYSVTLTRGLIDCLDSEELECVIAHELTHIRNHDVHLLVVTTIIAGVGPLACDIIVLLFRGLMWLCFLPFRAFGAMLPGLGQQISVVQSIQNLAFSLCGACFRVVSSLISLLLSLFVSRKREFMADAGAVELTKNPEALISALRKITGNSNLPTSVDSVRQMFFDNPVSGLFSTHPSVEKRIAAIARHAQQYNVIRQQESYVGPTHTEENVAIKTVPIQLRRFDVDYEAFLRRHIANFPVQTLEFRNDLYKKTASVLVNQFEKANPSLTENELYLEKSAFNNAIQNVERSFSSPPLGGMRKETRIQARATSIVRTRHLVVGLLGLSLVLGVAVWFFVPQEKFEVFRNSWLTGNKSAEENLSGVYAFDLASRNQRAMDAYKKALPYQLSLEPWAYNLSGVSEPMETMNIRDKKVVRGFICKPKDCANNQLVFIIALDGSRVVGTWLINGNKRQQIGAGMTDWESRLVQQKLRF